MAPSIRKKRQAQRMYHILLKLFPKSRMMLKYSNHWELLVAVILSAQCTDKKVNEVTAKLFKKYKTIDDYIQVKPKEFERDIYSTGFFRNKTKNILASAKMLKAQFQGKLPKTINEMLTLPGVARKTANVVLGNAYGIVEGIAVDTHVKRLANRLGLSKHRDPNKIEQDLMLLFPRTQWFKLTYLLIEYGRKYCSAKRHVHTKCPLYTFSVQSCQ